MTPSAKKKSARKPVRPKPAGRPARRAGNQDARAAVRSPCVYEGLFERALDPAFILKLDGEIVRANAAASFALGWSPDELVGKHREDLVVPSPALRSAVAERARKGSARAELTVRRADGSTFLAQVTAVEVCEAEEQPLAWVMFRDLTTERAAAQALVESEQRFAAVFDRAPLAMALSRFPESTYVAGNDAWRRLFELEGVDIVGKTGVELGIASAEAWERTKEQLRREGSIRGREVVRRTKGGEERTLMLSMEPLSIGGERHVISIALDVTPVRAAEAALRACEERLRARGG